MSDRFELFLTCPKGLEGLLIEEAVGLGLEEAREHTSAVRGMADMETAYRLCLWSRLANRVLLLVLKRFPMKDAEDLYHGVLDIDWADHMLPAPWPWSSAATARASTTHFGALKVKDAIVDKLRTRRQASVHRQAQPGPAHSPAPGPWRSDPVPRPVRPQPAPARLPPAAGRRAAEGKPRGSDPDPCRLAAHCGRRRRAGRPDVRCGFLLVEAAMIAADMAPNLRASSGASPPGSVTCRRCGKTA
jgi:hypothetical protein